MLMYLGSVFVDFLVIPWPAQQRHSGPLQYLHSSSGDLAGSKQAAMNRITENARDFENLHVWTSLDWDGSSWK
jgi:hypothetical protein